MALHPRNGISLAGLPALEQEGEGDREFSCLPPPKEPTLTWHLLSTICTDPFHVHK